MTFISFKTYIEFYHTAAWHVCADVLPAPPPIWEYGLRGGGVEDLVADTGILTFTLDNGRGNAAGLAGYYSIGHANCPAWFVDGLPIRVRCERQDDMTIATRFLGYMVSSVPSSGMYTADVASVEARDWMDYAYIQRVGTLAIETGAGLGVDDALTSALANFPVQPAATDFDVGKEVFAALFDSDQTVNTMAALFQKMARNECGGHIYLTGDGTLTFHNRHVRPATTTDAFTLDATASNPMQELDVAWDRNEVINRVEVTLYPAQVDTGSTTILWQLREPLAISAGQVLVLTCEFVDPDTGDRISGSGVVTPLVSATHIKFGSTNDGSSNDLIAALTFPMVVGGNSVVVTLTNLGAANGFLNYLRILGNGIYTYEPVVVAEEDATSIAARGERLLTVKLEQASSSNLAQTYADFLLGALKDPGIRIDRVRFLANFSDAYATAALTVEPNTRFSIKEAQTGADAVLFACRLRFAQEDTLLWVEIVPGMLLGGAKANYFVWDLADHGWDEGAWAF